MIRTLIYLSRVLTLFFYVTFPIYLAIRGSASLSDVALLLSSLSERAEALHAQLASPLAAPLVPISKELFEASAEPGKPAPSLEDGARKKYDSLPDGLAHCINSFEQYAFLAEQVLQRKRARYYRQTPPQKAISNKLGYPAHFKNTTKGINVNTRLSEQIAHIARQDYQTGPQVLGGNEDAEFGVVDLAFGHLSRDWSAQGARERQAVFPPVLTRLEQHFGGNVSRNKVLVPGSGLGRLASDIADIGMSPSSSLS